MKLIVGLGNPGEKYHLTRHNVGFWTIGALREKLDFPAWESFQESLLSAGNHEGEKLILIKPLTFMNLSGNAVVSAMNFYKIGIEDVFILTDDLHFEIGKVRLRKGGQSAGHNGIKSIIERVGEDFWRYRIGVGPQPEKMAAEDFVLKKLNKEEEKNLKDASSLLADYLVENINKPHEARTINLFG